MTHFLAIIFPLFFFSVACAGGGLLVLNLFPKRPRENAPVEYIIAFVLGQGVLGSFFLIPALIGLFTKPFLLVLITPLALIGSWKGLLLAQEMSTTLKNNFLLFREASFLWKVLAVATAWLLFAGFSGVAGWIDGDARAFYLALPKVIAASHRLLPLPGYESFTSVGLLAEMQLAALFLLDMPGASPRLFSWVCNLAGAVLLMAIARNAGLGKRGQVLSLVMLLTSSAVAFFWGQGKNDLFAAVFALPGVLFAIKSWDLEENRSSSVMLAGVFTGFALVAKLSYIVAFLPSMFVLIFWKDIQLYWRIPRDIAARKKLLFDFVKYSSIYIIAVLIPCIPHFFKNYILLNTFVDTYGAHHYFSDATTRRIVLTYPFWLFFGSFWAQYGTLSPLLLAFFPLFIFVAWRDRQWSTPVTALFFAGGIGLFFWILLFPSVPMPRYFLGTLLLFIIPVAWAMERVSYVDRWLNYTVTFIALGSIFIFYKSWNKAIFPVAAAYQYLLGEQSENNLNVNEVLSRNVYESINQSAAKGTRVYLGSYYRFWLRPDLIQCTNGRNIDDISFDAANPEKFWLQVYEHGFTYMFMDTTYPAFPALKTVPDWMRIENIYPQSGYGGAYRLIFINPPGKVMMTTREVSPGAWDVVSVK